MIAHPTIEDLVDVLHRNATSTKIALDLLVEAALSIGDELVAQELRFKGEDLALVLPQLDKLKAIQEEAPELLPLSDRANQEERGMRLVYLEALKMFATARMVQRTLAGGENSRSADHMVGLLRTLVGRVRHLASLAVDELAPID